MKKKIVSTLMMAITLGVTLLGSSCGAMDWFVNKIPAPERIEIDGVTYVTYFYREDTNTDGAKRENPSEPLFKEGNYQFWKIADTEYDLYGCIHSHQISWSHPHLYCREDQLEEVKAYYEDNHNATYYFNYNFNSLIELSEDVNKAYLNEGVEYTYSICEDQLYDPFEKQGFTTIEAVLSEITYYPVNVTKYSKDKVFHSPLRIGYYYMDGKLYARKATLMQMEDLFKKDGLENYNKQPDVFYLLEGETYDYILELFEEYALDIIKS